MTTCPRCHGTLVGHRSQDPYCLSCGHEVYATASLTPKQAKDEAELRHHLRPRQYKKLGRPRAKSPPGFVSISQATDLLALRWNTVMQRAKERRLLVHNPDDGRLLIRQEDVEKLEEP